MNWRVAPLAADRKGRLRAVADILSATDRTIERSLMKRMREEDEQVAKLIREQMFAFDDLARLSRRRDGESTQQPRDQTPRHGTQGVQY